MHQADIIPARHSSSENIEMEQPQYPLDEEPEKETVSLASAHPQQNKTTRLSMESSKPQ